MQDTRGALPLLHCLCHRASVHRLSQPPISAATWGDNSSAVLLKSASIEAVVQATVRPKHAGTTRACETSLCRQPEDAASRSSSSSTASCCHSTVPPVYRFAGKDNTICTWSCRCQDRSTLGDTRACTPCRHVLTAAAVQPGVGSRSRTKFSSSNPVDGVYISNTNTLRAW